MHPDFQPPLRNGVSKILLRNINANGRIAIYPLDHHYNNGTVALSGWGYQHLNIRQESTLLYIDGSLVPSGSVVPVYGLATSWSVHNGLVIPKQQSQFDTQSFEIGIRGNVLIHGYWIKAGSFVCDVPLQDSVFAFIESSEIPTFSDMMRATFYIQGSGPIVSNPDLDRVFPDQIVKVVRENIKLHLFHGGKMMILGGALNELSVFSQEHGILVNDASSAVMNGMLGTGTWIKCKKPHTNHVYQLAPVNQINFYP